MEEGAMMNEAPEQPDLASVDPETSALIAAEERRQQEKIILIPSESYTPPAVREALGSVFTSIYAEGYPRAAMRACSIAELSDMDTQLASHRRYADWRFYKGTEFVDVVESLAGRRAAECFATPECLAGNIYANVQPLSGAAANLAIYEAFVEPGETVMGMALTEGGHLTHGSAFNITGKRYRIVSYAVDPQTGKLNYDSILHLAREHRPKLIIAGFTSYPWRPDWKRLREIANDVNAVLLADIAHTAGMVIGGVYPNPIGFADVVMFTTHKTLCGPRGAIILSTEPEIAGRIDNAIFPGEQGGPHVNKFAAIAVALKIAQSKTFRDLQRRIVENAAYLASVLQEEGLTLAYGGTDTHLLVIDLKTLECNTGFTMMGEIASRILDLVGIVCNKNTIPGDHSAADAHGIRLGTPWATQRGMGKEEMKILAGIIAEVLHAIRPFSYPGLTGELSRGKLPLAVLEEAKKEVRGLLARVDPDIKVPRERAIPPTPGTRTAFLCVHGGRATALLNEATPSDILSLNEGETCPSFLFDEEGSLISEIIVGKTGAEEYLVLVPTERLNLVKRWLVGLADGYVLFDKKDLFRKVQGPAVIEEIQTESLPTLARGWVSLERPKILDRIGIAESYREHPERFAVHKPYFIGQGHLDLSQGDPSRGTFAWTEKEARLKRTPLHEKHTVIGARLVPFAGWEMPVWYTSALEEHRAVRETAGLFDLGHMGVFEISGEAATEFLNVVTSNYAAWLNDGESQYAYLLDPDGGVIDDIFVYRRDPERYLLVVNAANEDKDWEWLTGVNEGRYLIDEEIPGRSLRAKALLRNLKTERGVIDVALQGPLSRKILEQILPNIERRAIAGLKRTEFREVVIENHQFLIARTGYTGEEVGYEIYSNSQAADWLWDRLLEVGRPLGLVPCGLACRDSTRTEAGLPLYGNELAGPYGINPFEAGFGPYIKLHKAFFIGRNHCISMYTKPSREIVRFEVSAPGARPIHSSAAVIDRNGTYLGRVTSCVSLGETQVGMAIVEQLGMLPGTPLTIMNPPRGKDEASKSSKELETGDRVAVPVPAVVLPRFPEKTGIPEVAGE
jgi:glycine hydroxymethyltransferase